MHGEVKDGGVPYMARARSSSHNRCLGQSPQWDTGAKPMVGQWTCEVFYSRALKWELNKHTLHWLHGYQIQLGNLGKRYKFSRRSSEHSSEQSSGRKNILGIFWAVETRKRAWWQPFWFFLSDQKRCLVRLDSIPLNFLVGSRQFPWSSRIGIGRYMLCTLWPRH